MVCHVCLWYVSARNRPSDVDHCGGLSETIRAVMAFCLEAACGYFSTGMTRLCFCTYTQKPGFLLTPSSMPYGTNKKVRTVSSAIYQRPISTDRGFGWPFHSGDLQPNSVVVGEVHP
uniref:Uncharacterized protein n=1 Tax=Pseudomonas deceptionensis TaxID=882211 RepID=A0A0F6P9J2_PSEDM|nr:hypothetical protein [Pseudomonas deceptionensis]